jgi:periplasmic copper chaperone A
MHRITRIACAGFLLIAAAAHAHGYAVGDVRVQHPWIRATVQGTREARAFMRIYNQGHVPERLLSATSSIASRVELRAGASSTATIDLPPRKSITFESSGPHLLFTGLKRPLLKGERIVLVLRFERSGELRIEIEVQSADSKRSRH